MWLIPQYFFCVLIHLMLNSEPSCEKQCSEKLTEVSKSPSRGIPSATCCTCHTDTKDDRGLGQSEAARPRPPRLLHRHSDQVYIEPERENHLNGNLLVLKELHYINQKGTKMTKNEDYRKNNIEASKLFSKTVWKLGFKFEYETLKG